MKILHGTLKIYPKNGINNRIAIDSTNFRQTR